MLEICHCVPSLSIQIEQTPGADMGCIKDEMEMNLPVKHNSFLFQRKRFSIVKSS